MTYKLIVTIYTILEGWKLEYTKMPILKAADFQLHKFNQLPYGSVNPEWLELHAPQALNNSMFL